jgi:hypothetical protein
VGRSHYEITELHHHRHRPLNSFPSSCWSSKSKQSFYYFPSKEPATYDLKIHKVSSGFYFTANCNIRNCYLFLILNMICWWFSSIRLLLIPFDSFEWLLQRKERKWRDVRCWNGIFEGSCMSPVAVCERQMLSVRSCIESPQIDYHKIYEITQSKHL